MDKIQLVKGGWVRRDILKLGQFYRFGLWGVRRPAHSAFSYFSPSLIDMARRAMVRRGTTRTGRSKESAASNQSENVRKRKSDEVADDGETATSALSRNPNQAEHTANEDVSTGGGLENGLT